LTNVQTDDVNARAIMETVEKRNDGGNQAVDMDAVLIDKNRTDFSPWQQFSGGFHVIAWNTIYLILFPTVV